MLVLHYFLPNFLAEEFRVQYKLEVNDENDLNKNVPCAIFCAIFWFNLQTFSKDHLFDLVLPTKSVQERCYTSQNALN